MRQGSGTTAVAGKAVYIPAPIVVTAIRWIWRGAGKVVRWWWRGWRVAVGQGLGLEFFGPRPGWVHDREGRQR
jgi:hypothetical protein